MQKKLLVVALVFILALSGCTQSREKTQASFETSNFQEIKLQLPDDMPHLFDIAYTDNGELYIATKALESSTINVFSDKGNGEWEFEYSTDIVLDKNDNSNILLATLTPQGSLFVLASTDSGNTCYEISHDTSHEFPIKNSEDIIDIQYCDQESIFIVRSDESLARINRSDGTLICDYLFSDSNDHLSGFSLYGDKVFAIVAQVNGSNIKFRLAVFDKNSGAEESTGSEINSAIDGVLQSSSDQNATPILSRNNASGALYLSCNNQLFECSDDDLIEITSQNSNLTNNNLIPLKLVPAPDKGVIINYLSNEYDNPYLIYRYLPENEDTDYEDKPVLTIYSLFDNPEVQQTASSYRDTNPNFSVNVQIGIPVGSDISIDDAIRSLNTEVLAGNGPDLFVLDGLPYDDYCEQGILMDINEYIEELTDSNLYFNSILNSFSDSEGSFGIPTRYSIPVIIGSDELMENTDSFDEMSSYLSSSASVEAQLAASSLLFPLFASIYPSLFNEYGAIDESVLSSFYSTSKNLSQAAHANIESEDYPYGSYIENMIEDLINMNSMAPGLFISGGGAGIELGIISSPGDFGQMSLATDVIDNNADYKLLSFDEEGLFIPKTILGISSGSSHTDAALDFLDFAISEDRQYLGQQSGLPINKAAFNKYLQETGKYQVDSGDNVYERGALSASEIEAAEDLIESLASCERLDANLIEIITASLKDYCVDKKQLDESVLDASRKINLYISE